MLQVDGGTCVDKTRKIDFKKEIKELIRKELRPLLYTHGFVLSKPTRYCRECDCLLQEIYFKVENNRLRTWISYRPIFDVRDIVSFGCDSIYTNKNVYAGFRWILMKDEETHKDCFDKLLDDFKNLKISIREGILHEFDQITSLDIFLQACEQNHIFFQKEAQSYQGFPIYYEFMKNVHRSKGKRRLHMIVDAMKGWNLPMSVRECLEDTELDNFSDTEADERFYRLCDSIRVYYKLKKINL